MTPPACNSQGLVGQSSICIGSRSTNLEKVTKTYDVVLTDGLTQVDIGTLRCSRLSGQVSHFWCIYVHFAGAVHNCNYDAELLTPLVAGGSL